MEFIKNHKNKLFFLIYIFFLIILFKFNPVMIAITNGESMSPTLKDRQVVLFWQKDLTKGNVVVAKSPESWQRGVKLLIKRIYGVPGDKLKITGDKLFINDKLVREYPNMGIIDNIEITIPKDKYFIIGDNKVNSYDSLFRAQLGYDDYLIDKSSIKKTKEIKIVE